MQQPINIARDGTIFVNFIKPIGRVLHVLKGKRIPPTVTVSIVAAAVVGCGAYYCYRKLQPNCP